MTIDDYEEIKKACKKCYFNFIRKHYVQWDKVDTEAEIEDLTQEFFLKAFKFLKKGERVKSFKTVFEWILKEYFYRTKKKRKPSPCLLI